MTDKWSTILYYEAQKYSYDKKVYSLFILLLLSLSTVDLFFVCNEIHVTYLVTLASL